jgi:hypothetical protein
MGSVRPYETAKGRRYRVRYRRPGHSEMEEHVLRDGARSSAVPLARMLDIAIDDRRPANNPARHVRDQPG